MTATRPLIGKWYQDKIEMTLFEVVAIDEQADCIEIQYDDGAISEIDFDSWAELLLSPASAPEDANAAFDGRNESDNWDAKEVLSMDSFDNVVDRLDLDSIGFDDSY